VEALRALDHVFARSSVFRSGWPALSSALGTHWRTLEGSVGVTVLVALAAWVMGQARRLRAGCDTAGRLPGFRSGWWVPAVLFVGPAALFYLLGHFNAPGYALTYAGLLAAGAAAGAARLAGDSAKGFAAMLAGIVLLNGALFLKGPAGIGQRALSYPEIADHDRYYREVRGFLGGSGDRPLLLASANFTDGLRVVQALVPADDAIICQASGHRGPLPEALRRLSWLDLRSPGEVRAASRPVYAVRRTREDLLYHRALFPEGFDEVPIGPGHVLLRLRKSPIPHSEFRIPH
jgi:hypothetical protein